MSDERAEVAELDEDENDEHEIIAVCAWCSEPIVATYDGEFLHKKEFDAKEAAYLASLPELPKEPEPEVLMSPRSKGLPQKELRRRAFAAFDLKDPRDG